MKSVVRIYFNVIFFLLFSACVAATSAESSPTDSIHAPAITPTSWPQILPTPASITSFDERLLATFTILKEPDEMVIVQGFIWTKTADGHVLQIDPATNMVVADIKVDTATIQHHYCQGMGTDGEYVWVCSASSDGDNTAIDVVRVDPTTQSVVGTFKVGKIFDQLDLPFLQNQIWVLSGVGDQLVGIDVASSEPTPAIDLGVRCFQLTAVGESLMASCSLDDVILQIDPAKREVTRRVDIETPRFVAGNENSIWVAQDNAILRLDPASLTPEAEFIEFLKIGKNGDIFITEDAVWIRQEDGFLYKIDPVSNQIVEQIKIESPLGGGSVLVTADSIWVTAYDDNLLFRLRLK